MSVTRRPLNQRQLDVLTWIAEGCPTGRWAPDDYTFKASAHALRSRHLITITKRRDTWTAALTAAGHHYLEHGTYPPKQSPPPKQPARREQQPKPDRAATPATAAQAPPPVDLVAPEPAEPNPAPAIRVPDRLTRPHPAITDLKTDPRNLLPFKPETKHRALRLLNALAWAAHTRGYEVTVPNNQGPGYSRQRPALTITINGHPNDLTVQEDNNRTPHTPTQKELEEAARPFGRKVPQYDYTPSGRLIFRLDRYSTVKQERFTDTKRIDLATRLADILTEMEARSAHAQQRHLAKQKADADRKQQWQTAYDNALTAHREQTLVVALNTRINHWQQHQQQAEYLRALEQHLAAVEPDQQQSAGEWLRWARTHHEQQGPFPRVDMPTHVEPTREDLKPFMGRWNPYGPG